MSHIGSELFHIFYWVWIWLVMCGIVFDVEVSGCRALVSRSMYGWSGKFCWLVFIVLLVGRLSWNLGQVAFSNMGGSGLNLFLPYLLPRGFLAFLAYLYCLPCEPNFCFWKDRTHHLDLASLMWTISCSPAGASVGRWWTGLAPTLFV